MIIARLMRLIYMRVLLRPIWQERAQFEVTTTGASMQ
jgi:hypothetical protein